MISTLTVHDSVEPAFAANNNLLVFATDDKYILYCAVALTSLLENSDARQNYDIVILEESLSEKSKLLLTNIAKDKQHISLRFYNLKEFLDSHKELLYVHGSHTVAIYNRLFIPKIFTKYKRALYLDCDIIVDGDVLELFSLDFKGKHVACVKDFIIVTTKSYFSYLKDTLKLAEYTKYFNSGVMLFDIKALKDTDFLADCFTILESLDKPKWPDQDVLNLVFQGKTLYLDKKWNYFAAPKPFATKNCTPLTNENCKPADVPHIIHFIGSKKPWTALQTPLSERFWHYAEKTPCYAELVQGLLRYLPERLTLARKKRALYSLLSYIPLASVSKKDTGKKLSYEYEISATEAFLRKHAPKA